MNDDTLFRELARVAREEKEAEEARLDERWDRLSAGELSAEEEAELRALAAESEEGRLAYEAFRPLGPEFQARVVQSLQALQSGAAEDSPSPAPTPPAPPSPAPTDEPRPRVLPFWRRHPARSRWLTAAASAAAGVILLLNVINRPSALPGFEMELAGGIQERRGESPPLSLLLAPGSPFELTMRPDTVVSGRLAARGFLQRGGELQPWDLPEPVISEGGVVKIEGTVGHEIAVGPGEWTVWVAVGRPGKLPDVDDLRPHLHRGLVQTRDWMARSAPIRVQRESG